MKLNRRDFLNSLSMSALPFIPNPFSKEKKVYSNNPPSFVRKDVGLLSNSDPVIVSYQKAVAAMKNLPANDKRSWVSQANIHKNSCQHHSWFFLPWHRCYLYYFEQICRELSGDPNFALPYWNWTTTPKIPATFWGGQNTLLDNSRIASPSSIASTQQIGASTMDKILNIKSFETFASGTTTGQLEGSPHNYIHNGFVRGDMGKLGTAALDPIFWLHHANIDRLWSVWNARGNNNSTDSAWLNEKFKNIFFDIDGNLVSSIGVSDVLTTNALGYTYDDAGALASAQSFSSSFANVENLKTSKTNAETLLANSSVEVPVELNDTFTNKINTLRSARTNSEDDEIVKLYIDGVEVPAKRDIYLRVFINVKDAKEDVPDTDPVSVGFINFFDDDSNDMGGMHMPKKNSYVFEITDNVKRLIAEGNFDPKNLKVRVLAIPYDHRRDSTPVKFDAVHVEIQKRVR